MESERSTEMEDLEGLMAHQGWRRFWERSQADWGPEQYRARVHQALAAVASDDRQEQAAKETVFQIDAAFRAVETLVRWPAERVKALRQKLEKPERVARPDRTHY